MWTSHNKKFLIFIGIILIFGIISGIFYPFFIGNDNKMILITSIRDFASDLEIVKINFITNHLITLPLLFASSFFIIGLPLCLFFIFYTGFILGFIIISFILAFNIKGFILGIVYVLITHLIYLFLLSIFIITLLKISIYIIRIIINKNYLNKDYFIFLLKRVILTLFLIMINDVFIYFLGDNILNIFNFLVN